MNNLSILIVEPCFCGICTPALYHEHMKGTASGQIGRILQTLKSILVGRKKEGESLSITRDRQPRLWSTIGQLLILVVKRKPIPNSLCLQLGTVPCYAIWSRFERPFLAATFLLSQPDWNLVHFRYLSFIDPAYTYFLLLRAAACTS